MKKCMLGLAATWAAGVMGAAEMGTVSGMLYNEFENAYLSSSGTLCDTRPISLQNLDWDLGLGDYGHFWGYGCFLGTLHDKQHELHRAAFNEFEGGVFYGYDWELSDDFTFSQSAGGIWNPLFGYRGENRDTLWEWRYFQSLENKWLTPYWDALGLIDPNQWVRIRYGVRHTFQLRDDLELMPFLEGVWGTSNRFLARYGERPNHPFLGGDFITSTLGVKLAWHVTEHWHFWLKIRQFDTINRQARRREREKTDYWCKTDYTIFTIGTGLSF